MKKGKKILAILFALVMGSALTCFGANEFRQTRQLAREGKETSAQVVDHSRSVGRKGRVRHHLTVAYPQAFRSRWPAAPSDDG